MRQTTNDESYHLFFESSVNGNATKSYFQSSPKSMALNFYQFRKNDWLLSLTVPVWLFSLNCKIFSFLQIVKLY